MKKNISNPIFVSYLNLIGRDTKVFERAFKDKRLTQVEKNILLSWKHLRSSEFDMIIRLTEPLYNGDDFLHSQQLLIRAIALHNSGQVNESLQLLKESISLMKDFDLRRMKFIAFFNLFNAYLNLGLYEQLQNIYLDWSTIKAIDENEEIALKRAEYRLLIGHNKTKQAFKILLSLEENLNKMSELNRLNFYLDLFDFFSKNKNWKECNRVLEKLKAFRVYHFGAHHKYLKTLVDFCEKSSSIYVYEKDFTQNKTFYFELSVLKNLQERQHTQALCFWEKLEKINPNLYQKEFKYCGDKNIFYTALQKLTIKKSSHIEKAPNDYTKEMKLIYYLQNYPQLTKHELFLWIWDKEVESKSELAKLQLMISRLKKKSQFNIQYKKGCYFLGEKEIKAS